MRVSIFTTSSDNASDFSARLRFWSMRTFSFSIDLIMMGVVALGQIFPRLLFALCDEATHTTFTTKRDDDDKEENRAESSAAMST